MWCQDKFARTNPKEVLVSQGESCCFKMSRVQPGKPLLILRQPQYSRLFCVFEKNIHSSYYLETVLTQGQEDSKIM